MRDEPEEYTETRPVLVVEIHSLPTAATVRREKRLAYPILPSLMDYRIVSRDEPRAERCTRATDGRTEAVFEAHEDIERVSVGLTLSMNDLFADMLPGDV